MLLTPPFLSCRELAVLDSMLTLLAIISYPACPGSRVLGSSRKGMLCPFLCLILYHGALDFVTPSWHPLFWETCFGTSPGLCTHLAEVMEPWGIENSVLPDLALLLLSSLGKRLPVYRVEIIPDGVPSTQHRIVRVEN